jgi:hypothetical protein
VPYRTTAKIKKDNVIYTVINPVSVLKAKAENIRVIPPDKEEKRNDLKHLLIACRTIPLFLHDLHLIATKKNEPKALRTILHNLFKALLSEKTAGVLNKVGINPEDLIPQELKTSPFDFIRKTIEYQLPRAIQSVKTARFKPGPPSITNQKQHNQQHKNRTTRNRNRDRSREYKPYMRPQKTPIQKPQNTSRQKATSKHG